MNEPLPNEANDGQINNARGDDAENRQENQSADGDNIGGDRVGVANDEDVDYHSTMENLLVSLFRPSGESQNAPKITEQDDPQTSKTFQQIMGILKLHPEYALESFDLDFDDDPVFEGRSGLKLIPIQACLAAGVSLEKLIELHDINPEMILYRKHQRMSLLHFACTKENCSVVDDDGIVRLASTWPTVVSQRPYGYDGLHPLCVALSDRKDNLSLEVVKVLFDLFPGVIVPIAFCDHPIELAIKNGCRIDVIRFLVERSPKELKSLSIGSYFIGIYNPVAISLSVAVEVCKLLPTLEYLKLVAVWTRYCKNSTALQHLRLMRLSSQAEGEGEVPLNLAPLLETISSGLSCNPTLPGLEVEDMVIPDINWLVDFLLGSIAPRKLKFAHLTLLDTTVVPKDETGRSHSGDTGSKLNDLVIQNPHSWTSDSFNFLLSHLSKLPFLDLLDLSSLGSNALDERGRQRWSTSHPEYLVIPDVSASLVKFLQNAPELRSLNLGGFVVDHQSLCQCLERHQSLQSLTVAYPDMKSDRKPEKFYVELLKSHNDALQKLHSYHMENPLIMYFLKLNQLGRAQVRSSSLTRGQFISMMSDALPQANRSNNALFHFNCSPKEAAIVHHSLLYGLLRELPGTWCGLKPTSRKRKHGASELAPKGWTNVSPTIGHLVTTDTPTRKVQLQWFTSHGVRQHVVGQVTLQRFANKTPLFRITYNGTYYRQGGRAGEPARGTLCLPADVADVKLENGRNDGYNWVEMTFPFNDEGLDALAIFVPCTNAAVYEAGLLFTEAHSFQQTKNAVAI